MGRQVRFHGSELSILRIWVSPLLLDVMIIFLLIKLLQKPNCNYIYKICPQISTFWHYIYTVRTGP